MKPFETDLADIVMHSRDIAALAEELMRAFAERSTGADAQTPGRADQTLAGIVETTAQQLLDNASMLRRLVTVATAAPL